MGKKIEDTIKLDSVENSLKAWLTVTNYSSRLILVESNVYKLWKRLIDELSKSNDCKLSVTKIDEESKDISKVQELWQLMLSEHIDRKSLVINIGGGVMCDVGGFAASTFKRGLDFINCPTTLLSMVDASVGGKVGFNFADVKNCIGSYDQPKAVLIDVKFLSTLPLLEMQSGFAEAAKHGLIADLEYFNFVTSKPVKDFNGDELSLLVRRSCEIKTEVVESDETETGPRKVLNLGHTVGHAIESISHKIGNPLTHGAAVALGILAEGKMAELSGKLKDEDLKYIKVKLQQAGLLIQVPFEIDRTELMRLIYLDKKNYAGKVKWTLLNGIGNADYDCEVQESIVQQGINYVI